MLYNVKGYLTIGLEVLSKQNIYDTGLFKKQSDFFLVSNPFSYIFNVCIEKGARRIPDCSKSLIENRYQPNKFFSIYFRLFEKLQDEQVN